MKVYPPPPSPFPPLSPNQIKTTATAKPTDNNNNKTTNYCDIPVLSYPTNIDPKCIHPPIQLLFCQNLVFMQGTGDGVCGSGSVCVGAVVVEVVTNTEINAARFNYWCDTACNMSQLQSQLSSFILVQPTTPTK